MEGYMHPSVFAGTWASWFGSVAFEEILAIEDPPPPLVLSKSDRDVIYEAHAQDGSA